VTAIDHLVVVARTLAQGVAWAEATFGARPAPGGRHALMGTHNRLFGLAAPADAYLEIIAVDPDAPPPARSRWFGIDEPALRAAVREAPRLVHFVARCDDVEAQRRDLIAAGFDPGPVLAAERETPHGTLRWRITVPDDGRPLAGGALPTLIEWRGRHPAASLPPSGLALERLTLRGVPPQAAAALRLQGVAWAAPPGPALEARLATPLGPVTLTSPE
jgi:hypothetical protein